MAGWGEVRETKKSLIDCNCKIPSLTNTPHKSIEINKKREKYLEQPRASSFKTSFVNDKATSDDLLMFTADSVSHINDCIQLFASSTLSFNSECK